VFGHQLLSKACASVRTAARVGGALVLALVVLAWRVRPRLGAIEIFVLSTAFVVLVYAAAEPRFWLASLRRGQRVRSGV
jgi:hypothetical protein